jgi:hypothetical protein
MKKTTWSLFVAVVAATILSPSSVRAQFGGMFEGPEQQVLSRFDRDGDKKLNATERRAALGALGNGGGGGFGFFGGGGPVNTGRGPNVAPASVKNVPETVPLFDINTVRTFFFEFEDSNWEKELMAFKNTDIKVPANLTVDGKVYKDVGVKFRGSSSFFMIPEGQKHSFDISTDEFKKGQSILGFDSLNFLNSHFDPSYLHAVLYLQVARDLMPAARANYVRVVVNGESWGIYPNVEPVNKKFIREWFKTDMGTRWKAPGHPNGRAGLEYWGDNAASYKGSYEIKGADDPKAWAAFIHLCKVLNTTPLDKLEAALAPILDVDGVLRFLALDNALSNQDGYWVRASDYNLYLDPKGIFHVLPHDYNETFGAGGAPPDPLVGLNDASKPLRSKLLNVPSLRAKYMQYMREIATKWLDWKTLEPLAMKYQAMIAADVKADVHKIDSNGQFDSGIAALRNFADRRRVQILNYPQR